MRYFEIPAVGGFQICDWKEYLPDQEFGDLVAKYRDLESLVEQIRYYLEREEERLSVGARLRQICFDQCTYRQRFQQLFQEMG